MCDSSSRTITPQLPDHPSQIKGVRSANDQMFTYSSWSSRSWLIVRGAQPDIQQHIGLDALKRLYEAKGFNPHLLRDVRRRVASKLACCLFAFALVAFLSVRLLVCARMCVVGSDPVASCIAVFSCPGHGGVCGQQPSAPGRDGADHQSGHPRPVPEFFQRQSIGNEVQLFVQTHGLAHLYAMFKLTVPHAASGRCRTRQQ